MASITQLEYVVALDQRRHFGRAAAQCHVAQPTLSAQIRKLEEELGVVLFDRNKQPILPTEDGKAFIEQAKVVLTEFRRFSLLGNRNADELSGEFRLAIIPTLAPFLMPLFLARFTRRYPRIELVIDEMSTERIIEAMDKDLVDAGLLATPLGLSRVEEEPLFYEPFFLYVGPGHRFASRKKISESMLEPRELWLPSEEHCLRRQVIDVCGGGDRGGCFPSVHLKGGSIETIVEMVSNGEGYTLLPQLAAESVHRRKYEGSVIPLERPSPAREVSLVHRRGHLKQSMMKLLRSSVEAHLPKGLPREKSRSFRVVELVGQFK
ncbi:MAG TPA: hydrogen peroxide-inducible genes activator [Terriglobia bacterium]|nr:hydrogen peroxide-inducible genes activator [Terriglobia bacterium]